MLRRVALVLATIFAIAAILAPTAFALPIAILDRQAHWPHTAGTVMRKYYYHGNGLTQTYIQAFDDGAANWTATNSPLSLRLSSSGSSPIWVNTNYEQGGNLGHTTLSVACNECHSLTWANSYINRYYVNVNGFSFKEITQLATHEEGHALGLPHIDGDAVGMGANIMNKFVPDGDIYYKPLVWYDVALANQIYPGWPSW